MKQFFNKFFKFNFQERQNINVWTSGEKEIFKEKFLQHPKNFGAIASSLDRKSAQVNIKIPKFSNNKKLIQRFFFFTGMCSILLPQ